MEEKTSMKFLDFLSPKQREEFLWSLPENSVTENFM